VLPGEDEVLVGELGRAGARWRVGYVGDWLAVGAGVVGAEGGEDLVERELADR